LLAPKQRKALNTVKSNGIWVLLLSWLPVVGDALCFAAGWLKLPLLTGLLMILVGKFCRYVVIAWIFV
jgi:membrane protein YqaA with SNARE-associated domain